MTIEGRLVNSRENRVLPTKLLILLGSIDVRPFFESTLQSVGINAKFVRKFLGRFRFYKVALCFVFFKKLSSIQASLIKHKKTDSFRLSLRGHTDGVFVAQFIDEPLAFSSKLGPGRT